MRPLIVYTALLIACGDEASLVIPPPMDAQGDQSGTIAAIWEPEPGCPSMDAVAVLRVTSISSERRQEYEYAFRCQEGGGMTEPLPLEYYEVVVVLTDDSAHVLLAMSDPAMFDLIPGDVRTWRFAFSTTHGTIIAHWPLETCADLGGESARLLVYSADRTEPLESVTPCAVGEATVAPIAIGDFDSEISLRDGAGEVVGSQFDRRDTIAFGNEHLDLGTFGF